MLFILLCGLSFVVWSCVDVNTTNVTTQDYRSTVRFIDVATDSSASHVLTVDGGSVATLALGDSSVYLSLHSGNRLLNFVDSQRVNFNTDEQGTVLIHSKVQGKRFLFLLEGDQKRNNAKAGVASVRFVNAADSSAATLAFRDVSALGTDLAGSVSYFAASGYTDVTPGPHSLFVVSNEGSAVLDGSQPVPATSSISSGGGRFALGSSTGLQYLLTVNADNSQGFYTAAHFRNADSGATGPVIYTLNLASQEITFSGLKLIGANEIPPDTVGTSASGDFVLTADSARTQFSLKYTITATVDAGDTLTSATFRTGAAGVTGPVVKNIVAAGKMLDTTLTGFWKTSDAQSLTSALVDSIMAGVVYVDFHSVKHPSGVIRAQLVYDPTSTSIFAGTWSDPSLTAALRTKLLSGKVYVNLVTKANLTGQIRGQLIFPSAGKVGVASLPVYYYAVGHRYTVVATGAGTTLNLYKFAERQVGVTKPAPITKIGR